MAYERLTNNNKEEYNPEYDFCRDCKYHGEPNGCNRQNGECENYERFMEMYDRLAELEEKIKSGLLVELPCKVGDKFYEGIPGLSVREFIADEIRVSEEGIKVFGCPQNDLFWHYRFMKEWFGKTIFTTKEAAEAKLNELRGRNEQ